MKKSGIFTYLGSDDRTEREYEYTYDDAWFDEPSNKENYDLLKFSLCVSYAASIKDDMTAFFDQLDYKYTDSINYDKEGLNVLAGDKVVDSVYYPAPEVDGKYYLNSIGYAIGHKEYNDSILMIAAIRGGHYGSEWGGNFNIGTGIDHAGFEMAANQVIDGIKREVEKLNTDKPIKILVSGYSRAAAAANLIGAFLNNGAVEGLIKDNIYVYCFECPRGTRAEDAFSDKYDNITSVSNPNDIVPKVAESVFGYKRFGKTYFLPSPETTYNFNEVYKNVMQTEKKVIPFLFAPAIDATLIEFNFVDDLAFVVRSLEYYCEHFQKPFMEASAAFLGGGKIQVTPEDMKELDIVQKSIMALDPVNTLEIIKGFGSTPENAFAVSFVSPILQNHAMELTLSWLETLDGFDGFGSDEFQLIYLNNPSDVEVVDDKGTLVSVKDGKVLENSNIFVNINSNEEVVVLLPESKAYKVKAKGKDVSVSYTVFNLNYGLKRKIENYDPINSDNIELYINAQNNNSELAVDGEVVTPTEVLEGDEVKYYKITPSSNVGAVVIGGGYATKGQFIKLEVKNSVNFDGWYVDGEKVSSDLIYKFKVTGDVDVVAKYNV